MSKAEEPSCTQPSRLTAPAAKRSASATVVFPAPPCPTMTTFRSLATSSADIPSSIALVNNAEPVERQELVDRLDGGGDRGDEGGEAPGGEGAGLRVVLLADALDQPVHQRRVAVGHARLDGVGRVAPDYLRGPDELDARQLRGAQEEGVERDADAGHDDAAGILPARGHVVE